jgi:hypothetical protein
MDATATDGAVASGAPDPDAGHEGGSRRILLLIVAAAVLTLAAGVGVALTHRTTRPDHST